MEISQHIKDLLFTQDRVILSGFGAFIAKYSPAKINEETKTISPPAKEILFDPKIIKDGGLLENHMAKREKISYEEARKQIDEYVKTVISKLKAGKKVKFPELGTFTIIKEGKIIFLYQPSGNLLLDSYGLPKITLPNKVQPINTEDKRKKPKVASTKSSKKWIIWTAIPVAIILILVAIYFLKPAIWNKGETAVITMFNKIKGNDNNNNNGDSISSGDTTFVNNTNLNNNTENNSNNTENNSNSNNTNNTENNTENNGNQDIINPENNTNNNVTNNTNPVTGDFLKAQKGKFYLIIGSLPTTELAKKETSRFKKMGINSDIIHAGKNKYRISIGEFNTANEASSFYETFHKKHKKVSPWLWENK